MRALLTAALQFSQSPQHRQALLDTHEAVICASSRRDCYWGTGLDATDPEANQPARFRGNNVLGQLLMRVSLPMVTRCTCGTISKVLCRCEPIYARSIMKSIFLPSLPTTRILPITSRRPSTKTKIACDCGATVLSKNLPRHVRTHKICPECLCYVKSKHHCCPNSRWSWSQLLDSDGKLVGWIPCFKYHSPPPMTSYTLIIN